MLNLHQIKKAQSLQEKVHVVLSGFAMMLLWVVVATFIITHMFHKETDWFGNYVKSFHEGVNLGYPTQFGLFVLACIFAPMWEEVKYRVVPILISKYYAPALIWPIALFASIDFGLAHGSVINIMVQGVGGLILTYVYIKNGYSYLSSAALHCLYNLSLMYLLPYIFT